MKDKKIVIDGLTTQDYEMMESHFSNMAKKGFLIEKLKFGYGVYKRIEPKDIQFAIGIYPKPKAFEKPNEEVVADYIKDQVEKGWKYLFSRECTHVFTNENEDEIEDIDKTNEIKYVKALLIVEIFNFILLALLNISNAINLSGIKIFDFNTNVAFMSIFLMPVLSVIIGLHAIYDIIRYIRIRKKTSRELQIKNIKWIVLLKKMAFIFTFTFLGLFLLAIIADGYISANKYILVLLPLIVAFMLVFKLRRFLPGRNLGAVGKTLIAMVGLLIIGVVSAFIGINSMDAGIHKELPDKYTAIKLNDIGFEQEVERVYFKRDRSIVVPLKYVYREYINIEAPNSTYVSTQVKRALTKDIADYIFKLELEDSRNFYGELISSRWSYLRIQHTDPYGELVSAAEFYPGYDNAVFLENSGRGIEDVLLQKGKYIFIFSGELDLKEESNIKLINDMVDKIITDLD
jgi:hypothetical protein